MLNLAIRLFIVDKQLIEILHRFDDHPLSSGIPEIN
jgi:hypothetical protein